MDNPTRSEITRKKAIDAAFAILTRDGVKGLTFDSLAQESGISKGGLMHQFPTKKAILQALLDHQKQDFDRIAHTHLDGNGASKTQRMLSLEIAMYRASANQPQSVARAMLAVVLENPDLLADSFAEDTVRVKQLQQEADDSELALLRYFAASGIAFNSLLGISPLSKAARERLFTRLMDDSKWQGGPAQETPKEKKNTR
jgi:AcrR family transcriptional regulator